MESGKHSLTALGNDKVIGYLSFVLQQDESSDVSLQKDGTYSVSIDQNGAGVDLHLVLNEELGTLAAAEVNTIDNKQPTLNLWWLWILLIVIVVLVAVGVVAVVVVVVIIRRKKAK